MYDFCMLITIISSETSLLCRSRRGPREIKFIFVYFDTMYVENIMFPLVPLLYLLYLLPESL